MPDLRTRACDLFENPSGRLPGEVRYAAASEIVQSLQKYDIQNEISTSPIPYLPADFAPQNGEIRRRSFPSGSDAPARNCRKTSNRAHDREEIFPDVNFSSYTDKKLTLKIGLRDHERL